MFNRRTYLDAAAGISGNPSSPHEEGRKARERLEGARVAIARLIEVQPDDIIFTSGATESNALAILGHVRALRLLAGRDAPGRNNMHVLYLPSAHASVVENVKLLAGEGVEIEALPISAGGGSASGGKEYRVDTVALAKMIRPETVLVSMDAVCGETGVVWNTREVASVIREPSRAKRGIVLHVDASQAPLTEKISRAHFGADLLAFDASKVGQVRGIGILVAHRTIPIAPLYAGGGQERGLRPGTEVPELAERFAAALRAAAHGREAFRASAERDRKRLVEAIMSTIPGALVNGGRDASPSADRQAPNILNLSFPGTDTDYLVALLDEAGFSVSTKSACETDSLEGSRAVLALTGDAARARSTLRVSWGPRTRPRALARFKAALVRALALARDERVGVVDNSSLG